MTRFSAAFSVAFFLFNVAAGAQSQPVVTNSIGDFGEYQNGTRRFDLYDFFNDPDLPGRAVRMTTVLGTIDLTLFHQQTPITVRNFLNYVYSGRYNPVINGDQGTSFIHRTVPGFVIQGGGYINAPPASDPQKVSILSILVDPPIHNEPGVANKRGTIAMAKLPPTDSQGQPIPGGGPDSATSQWFINLADNVSLDDPNNNGGFTAFGQVLGNGMTVVDAIAAVPRFNLGSPFNEIPLRQYNPQSGSPKTDNLILLPSIKASLQFSAASDSAATEVRVEGSQLLVDAKQPGTAHITVTATDLDGTSVTQNLTVTSVSAPGRLVNISTRVPVGTGDDVLIGGFIVRGTSAKRVMIRAIGPSLTDKGVSGALADPVLELHDSTGATIATNDNWQTNSNRQDIIDSTIAPTSPNESAILTTLPSNSGNGARYTAIMRGANNTTGIGLVEVYDLDSGPGSTILNISTRGRVQIGDDVMIGGFFLGGTESKNILVRAIGPSLKNLVTGELNDPMLELHDAQGAILASNDNWETNGNKQAIIDSTLAPSDPKESAVLNTVGPGRYTAIVRGLGDTPTGVALVEVYQLP
jgi:cyclophilin family peptidyl-prolyl cis-trans isomerase